MHRPSHIKSHRIEEASTTPNYKPSSTGKLPNLYHHYAFTHPIGRNIDIYKLAQQYNTSHNKPIYKYVNLFTKINTPNNNIHHTKESASLLYKAQLHEHEGGGDISTNFKNSQNIGNYCDQQMANRGKAVHEAIMRSPIDTSMEDTYDMMVIEAIQAKRTQEGKKGGSSSKRKKNAEPTTGLKEAPKDFWLGIVTMERLAIDEGVKAKDL